MWSNYFSLEVLATPVLIVALVLLSRIDLETCRLPDRGTLPLLAAGWGVAFWRDMQLPWAEIAGAGVGFMVFWAIGALFWHRRGQDGLGLGDAKLAAAGGAWVGISLLPLVVLIGAGSALVFILATGRDRSAPLPFGPWLAVGIAVGWSVRVLAT